MNKLKLKSEKIALKFKKLLINREPKNQNELRLFTFATGAIYSISRAIELNYDDDTWTDRYKERKRELSFIVRLISNGRIPRKNQWLSEYYFNNAILRLDVLYERIAQHVTEYDPDKDKQRDFKKWEKILVENFKDNTSWINNWKKIRKIESNILKHKSHTIFDNRRTKLDEVLNIIDEAIDTIHWALRSRLRIESN